MNTRNIIRSALVEDVGSGDVTTDTIVPEGLNVKAVIAADEGGIVSGLAAAKEVFTVFDPGLEVKAMVSDGEKVKKGTVLLKLKGSARTILTCERIALNLLQRLSGISTLTAKYVKLAKPYGATILDTRKTTPGLRALEKYAVKAGGGENHRMGLFDGTLIKDNHIKIAGSILKAVSLVKAKYPGELIEVEAQNLKEVQEALKAEIEVIMLDNLSYGDMKKAVKLINKQCRIEVSGGVNLKTIEKFAKLNVDYISVGALTHSAKSLNISLDILG
ncbi:MAG: carboxylating nicotinate-nucleotide diphosphorylase [Candidatus Firestonebacteria bacterium]|nr:carboxylating nicotinate-nucleotide diphosphorylase [Candidatus Firestonebacteria bacterium]